MIHSYLEAANIHLSKDQIRLFEKFLHLFQEKNRQINLSSMNDEKDIVIKHFIDSLLLSKIVSFSKGEQVIDIGSGGGFPGVPLAIMYPLVQFTLCDSVGKKMKAVEEMYKVIGLNNVKTLIGRAEELGKQEQYREQYDYAIARAVAGLPTLLEYLSPFVKKGGMVVAYKGKDYKEELEVSENAFQKLSLKVESVKQLSLPEGAGERYYILCRKKESLSPNYPRDIGVPKKKPL